MNRVLPTSERRKFFTGLEVPMLYYLLFYLRICSNFLISLRHLLLAIRALGAVVLFCGQPHLTMPVCTSAQLSLNLDETTTNLFASLLKVCTFGYIVILRTQFNIWSGVAARKTQFNNQLTLSSLRVNNLIGFLIMYPDSGKFHHMTPHARKWLRLLIHLFRFKNCPFE